MKGRRKVNTEKWRTESQHESTTRNRLQSRIETEGRFLYIAARIGDRVEPAGRLAGGEIRSRLRNAHEKSADSGTLPPFSIGMLERRPPMLHGKVRADDISSNARAWEPCAC